MLLLLCIWQNSWGWKLQKVVLYFHCLLFHVFVIFISRATTWLVSYDFILIKVFCWSWYLPLNQLFSVCLSYSACYFFIFLFFEAYGIWFCFHSSRLEHQPLQDWGAVFQVCARATLAQGWLYYGTVLWFAVLALQIIILTNKFLNSWAQIGS